MKINFKNLNVKRSQLNSLDIKEETERIIYSLLENNGYDIEYMEEEFEQQFGDILLYTEDENEDNQFIEVKSNFVDIANGNNNKIAIDIQYFQVDNNGELLKEAYYVEGKKFPRYKPIPYIQRNTGTNSGWIYTCRADVLISVNIQTQTIYVINNYQEFRNNLIALYEDKTTSLSSYVWKYGSINFRVGYSLDGKRLKVPPFYWEKCYKSTHTVYLNLECKELMNDLGAEVDIYNYEIIEDLSIEDELNEVINKQLEQVRKNRW